MEKCLTISLQFIINGAAAYMEGTGNLHAQMFTNAVFSSRKTVSFFY